MPKVSLAKATLEVADDDIGKCAYCSDLALEGERLCMCCKTYEDDINSGVFEAWD